MSIKASNLHHVTAIAHAMSSLNASTVHLGASSDAQRATVNLIGRLSIVAISLMADPEKAAATETLEPTPVPPGDEVIVKIESTPGLAVEKLEDLTTLEAYFVRAAAQGIIDFTLRCTHHQEGEGAHFYIHPANISGETLQFVVAENTIRNE